MNLNPESKLIVLTDFTVCREGVELFSPLTAELKPSEALEVMGKNGIGKTSLLEALAGLSNDFLGSKHIAGECFYLSTVPPFDPNISVHTNLTFWAKLYRSCDNTINQALARWDLLQLQNIKFKHLSSGQKQRLNLARMCLKESKIWLLDEPLTSLDKDNSEKFKVVLSDHLKGGNCAVIATHQPIGLGRLVTLVNYCSNVTVGAA